MKKKVKLIYNTHVFHKGQLITWADEKHSPLDTEIIKRIVTGNIFTVTNITKPNIPEVNGHKQSVTFVCKNQKDQEFTYSGAYFKPYIDCEEVKMVIEKAA